MQLIKLPCHTTVTTVLEGFLRYYASILTNKGVERTRVSQRTNSTSSTTSSNAGETTSTATQMSLCKEFLDGIRVSFDFLIEQILLYPEERLQFNQIKSKLELRKRGKYEEPNLSSEQ